MNRTLLFFVICACLVGTSVAQIPAGYSTVSVGQQYIAADAGSTIIVAPEFQPPTVGTFSISAVTTSGTNSTLTLAGTPPLDSYGAPVLANSYNQKGYPVYYALVTDGTLKGNFYNVLSNTKKTLVINNQGTAMTTASVKSIDLRPYWTLESLFPADAEGVAFIGTNSTTSVMTQLVVSPTTISGNQQPQDVGKKFYFNSSLKNWVSTEKPTVPAGGVIVPPGRYLYFQNTGNGTYPVDSFIAGTVLKTQFNVRLYSSSNQTLTTLFALPRASDYKLSTIGLNDLNFSSKATGTTEDFFIVYDGFGGVGATYYRKANKWYLVGYELPVDSVIASGTCYGVLKPKSSSGNKVLINQNNK